MFALQFRDLVIIMNVMVEDQINNIKLKIFPWEERFKKIIMISPVRIQFGLVTSSNEKAI